MVQSEDSAPPQDAGEKLGRPYGQCRSTRGRARIYCPGGCPARPRATGPARHVPPLLLGTPTAIAVALGLCCTVFVGLIATLIAGPFLVFGLGLLAAGIWQRNRFLTGWAVLIGGIGVFEGFFGITNRLPSSLWRPWEHPAIYLLLALATAVAGLVALRQENEPLSANLKAARPTRQRAGHRKLRPGIGP